MEIITRLKTAATKKNVLIVSAFVVVLICSITAGIMVQRSKRTTKDASGLTTLSYEDAVKSGRLSASDTEVLVVNMSYDKTKKPELSVKNLKRFTNSTPEKVISTASDYKLEVIKGKDALYTTYFAKPQDTIAESFDEKSKKISGSLSAKDGFISKTIPWLGDDTELRVTDAAGKVVLTQALKDVPVTKNTPDFQTIDGQDVR